MRDRTDQKCIGCGEVKPLLEFYRVKSREDSWHTRCKACYRSYNIERRARKKAEYAGPTSEVKTCSKCDVEKTAEEFYEDPIGKFGLSAWCRQCTIDVATISARRRQQSMSEEIAEYLKFHHIRSTYGLKEHEWFQMVKDQSGLCAICSEDPEELFVDHDHETGAVRELLCGPCNSMLGDFKDDPTLMQQAILYLQQSER